MKRLYIDNDILYILASAGMLGDVITLLGYTADQVRVLPYLRHKLERHIARFSDEHRERCLHAAEIYTALSLSDEEMERAVYIRQHCRDIDEGEASLLVALTSGDTEGTLLTTKDVRFVRALAASDLEEKKKARRKILLPEQLLTLLYEKHGFSYLVSHFTPCREYDRRLQIYFSVGTEESFVQALLSYARSDAEVCHPLLVNLPLSD